MSKVKFEKSGESYLLPEELWNLVLTKVDKVEKSEYWGYKMIFSIMDSEPLEKGEGNSLGRYLNVMFWASNDEKAKKLYKQTGDFMFPPTGKFANTCKALAKSKDIDITSEDFDPEKDLIGCICKGLTKNDTNDDGNTYSNLDSTSIREATSKTQAAYSEWKAWKKAQKERSDDFKSDKKQKPSEEKKKPVAKDDDDFDEKPAKKKPVVEDDDPPKKKKPVADDDDFEDEKPAKKKKPADDDDDLFD